MGQNVAKLDITLHKLAVYLVDVVDLEMLEKQQQDGRDSLHNDLLDKIVAF